MEPINPVDHGVEMYRIFRQGTTHEAALFRAIVCACEEQRGRCAEAVEERAADVIRKMPPVNLDWKTGILR